MLLQAQGFATCALAVELRRLALAVAFMTRYTPQVTWCHTEASTHVEVQTPSDTVFAGRATCLQGYIIQQSAKQHAICQ